MKKLNPNTEMTPLTAQAYRESASRVNVGKTGGGPGCS